MWKIIKKKPIKLDVNKMLYTNLAAGNVIPHGSNHWGRRFIQIKTFLVHIPVNTFSLGGRSDFQYFNIVTSPKSRAARTSLI